jgi:hypothetical protein
MMRRNRIRRLLVLAASLAVASSGHAQTPLASARAAALSFAMTAGFEVPLDVLVVEESNKHFGPTTVTATGPARMAQRVESQAVAALIGPSVQLISGYDALECLRGLCATLIPRHVLSVSEPELAGVEGRYSVLLVLHSPSPTGDRASRSSTGTVVAIRKVEGGWVGHSVVLPPVKTRTRIPPARP